MILMINILNSLPILFIISLLLKHACTHLPNGTNQRRSEVLERAWFGTVRKWLCSDNVSTCKPLRFPWSQDMIDMMAIYRLSQTLQDSEDKWVPNCPVNPDDSKFCSTFPPTWREVSLIISLTTALVCPLVDDLLKLLLPKSDEA